jgi:uncharacterized protein with HEPN domain
LRSLRADRLLVEDMLESLGRIARYTAGMQKETFLSDRKTIDAVVRNLEIIGEAAARLTVDARQRRPATEWLQIIGLRNRIVHEYFDVDTEIVWQIISRDLPQLSEELHQLLETLPAN